jgi:hypothetical protein
MLVFCIGESALAFDCLAYKPERAQGQWHADVVAGKICWYGPNWRSFLPKSKSHVESSQIAISKPERVVHSKIHNELETVKPGTQVEIEDNKPDVEVETSKPGTLADPRSMPTEAATAERVEDSSGLREASPAEAAAFTNVISLEFETAPTRSSDSSETPVESYSVADLFIAFSMVALATGGFVTLIMLRGKKRVMFDAETEPQPLEYLSDNEALTASLQPFAGAEDQLVTVPSWLIQEPGRDPP